jgi:hypothetical protein
MYRSLARDWMISRQTAAAILSTIVDNGPDRDDGSNVIAIPTGASAIVTGTVATATAANGIVTGWPKDFPN